MLFQIAYAGDFRSLFAVTFWQKVDFLISNVCWKLQLPIHIRLSINVFWMQKSIGVVVVYLFIHYICTRFPFLINYILCQLWSQNHRPETPNFGAKIQIVSHRQRNILLKSEVAIASLFHQILQPDIFFYQNSDRSKNNNKITGKWDCWVCQTWQFTSERQNYLVLKLKRWFQRWDSIQNSS